MKQKTLTNNLKETRIEEKQFQTQAISQFDRQPKEHYPQNTIVKPKEKKVIQDLG